MKGIYERFSKDDDGAVTLDWIVLTGLVVGVTLSVMAILQNGADSGSANMVAPATITTEF